MVGAVLLGSALQAVAQTAAPAPAASGASAPAAAQLKRVEITATRPGDTQERRESTAAKIVIGRDEIERYGDSNLGDVLKRLPGVTIQGRPGRGGNIRLRGLGSGYTQILLDGQRIPPGFALDSLTPEQVERIEILRAPTAETGARAIAGTINIITREGFNKHINDLRLIAGIENGRLQPSAVWTRNEPVGAFIVNYSLSVFSQDRASPHRRPTVDRSLIDDALLLDQTDVGAVHEKRRGLHATGRLQWRSEAGAGQRHADAAADPRHRCYAAPRQPDADHGRAARALRHERHRRRWQLHPARLNGQWNHRFEAGGRLETKFGLGQGRSLSATLREETTAGALSRTLDDRYDIVDRNLLLATKFTRVLEGDHVRHRRRGRDESPQRAAHDLAGRAPVAGRFRRQRECVVAALRRVRAGRMEPDAAMGAARRPALGGSINTRGSGECGRAQPQQRLDAAAARGLEARAREPRSAAFQPDAQLPLADLAEPDRAAAHQHALAAPGRTRRPSPTTPATPSCSPNSRPASTSPSSATCRAAAC